MPVPERRVVICRKRMKAAHHCLGSWTVDQRRVEQRLHQRKMEAAYEHGMAEIARAGTAKPAELPAQAIRYSVFSQLFNSGYAVCGRAGPAPNAADGIARKNDCITLTAEFYQITHYNRRNLYFSKLKSRIFVGRNSSGYL